MSVQSADKRFSDLSTAWVVTAIGAGALCLFALGHFGFEAQGRIASFSVCSLVMTMRMCWPLNRRNWFWPTFLAIWALHAALVLLVDWPAPHYPALALAPLAAVDIAAMIYLVSFIDGRATKMVPKASDDGEEL
jgi:hypothetical protein